MHAILITFEVLGTLVTVIVVDIASRYIILGAALVPGMLKHTLRVTCVMVEAFTRDDWTKTR